MPTKVSEGRLRSPLFLFPKDSEMNKEINETDAEFVSHEPCEACGSSDANALYSDGSMWCFLCQTYKPSDDDSFETTIQTKVKRDLIEGAPGSGGVALSTTRGAEDSDIGETKYHQQSSVRLVS